MECRLATKVDLNSQKNIWKQTFGDEDRYIDFYYANRYREEETALLISHGEIAAMLAMLPMKLVMPDSRALDAAMIYAIATHPKYQKQGFASDLMEYGNQNLKSRNINFSILVPAEETLFGFYKKRGYQNGFTIRETVVTRNQINSLEKKKTTTNQPPYSHRIEPISCRIEPADPQEYNHRRDRFLNGRKYVAYQDRDIAYQKKLSQLSGADIYLIDIYCEKGCFAVERISDNKVIIKEMLLYEEHLEDALKQFTLLIEADEYILRTPAFLEHRLGGEIHPFGMIRVDQEFNLLIQPEELGYLGLAFD